MAVVEDIGTLKMTKCLTTSIYLSGSAHVQTNLPELFTSLLGASTLSYISTFHLRLASTSPMRYLSLHRAIGGRKMQTTILKILAMCSQGQETYTP